MTPRCSRVALTRRPRGQSGATLLELLVAMAISSIIIAPLAAWSASTLQHQGTARDELGRATATGLLNTYFLRDVASASTVSTTDISDCGPGPGAGGRTVLVITTAGSDPERIVYSEVGTATPTALWRRSCRAYGSPAVTSSTKVFPSVRSRSVDAGCPAVGSDACVVNRKVELRLTPVSPSGRPGQVTVIGAVRRGDAGSVGLGASSPPVAAIAVSSIVGYRDTEFTFTSTSTDPDGPLAAFQWSFPGAADATVVGGDPAAQSVRVRFGGQPGPRSVSLVVTDSSGATSTALGTITILGRSPTARATCLPGAAPRTFDLSATSSTDPEGLALTYQWSTPEGPLPTGDPVVWSPADTMVGPQQVTVVVTDVDGNTDSALARCDLGGATSFPGGVLISPEPVNTGPGIPPLVGSVAPGSPLAVTFSIDGTPPAGSRTGWELYTAGAATPLKSVNDTATFVYSFQPDQAGRFEIVRVTLPAGGAAERGPRVPFRVNAAPVADFRITAESGTVPARTVEFDSSASVDPDGSVASRLWDFGVPGATSADATPVFTYTAAGFYPVTLIVRDNDGATSLKQLTVVVPAKTP